MKGLNELRERLRRAEQVAKEESEKDVSDGDGSGRDVKLGSQTSGDVGMTSNVRDDEHHKKRDAAKKLVDGQSSVLVPKPPESSLGTSDKIVSKNPTSSQTLPTAMTALTAPVLRPEEVLKASVRWHELLLDIDAITGDFPAPEDMDGVEAEVLQKAASSLMGVVKQLPRQGGGKTLERLQSTSAPKAKDWTTLREIATKCSLRCYGELADLAQTCHESLLKAWDVLPYDPVFSGPVCRGIAGWIHVRPLRFEAELKEVQACARVRKSLERNPSLERVKAYAPYAAQMYKLQLVPRLEHLHRFVEAIATAVAQNEKLADSVSNMKWVCDPFATHRFGGKIMPRIVIFPVWGMEPAATLLKGLLPVIQKLEEELGYGDEKPEMPPHNRSLTATLCYRMGDGHIAHLLQGKSDLFNAIFTEDGALVGGEKSSLNL
jgi:hypothetical protein